MKMMTSMVCEILVCRLCLKKIALPNISNQLERDVIQIVIPQIDLNIFNRADACRECVKMLQRAFLFKSKCLEIEDSLHEYKKDGEGQINLEEILGIENNSNGSVKICRTCLGYLENNACYIDLDDKNGLKPVLNVLLPQVDIMSTFKPVMCNLCQETLNEISKFISFSLKNEEEIKYHMKNMSNTDGIDLSDISDIIQYELNESNVQNTKHFWQGGGIVKNLSQNVQNSSTQKTVKKTVKRKRLTEHALTGEDEDICIISDSEETNPIIDLDAGDSCEENLTQTRKKQRIDTDVGTGDSLTVKTNTCETILNNKVPELPKSSILMRILKEQALAALEKKRVISEPNRFVTAPVWKPNPQVDAEKNDPIKDRAIIGTEKSQSIKARIWKPKSRFNSKPVAHTESNVDPDCIIVESSIPKTPPQSEPNIDSVKIDHLELTRSTGKDLMKQKEVELAIKDNNKDVLLGLTIFVCNYCEFNSRSVSKMILHSLSHVGNSEKVSNSVGAYRTLFYCVNCTRSYKTLSFLNSHIGKCPTIPNDKVFLFRLGKVLHCVKCSFDSDNMKSVLEHLLSCKNFKEGPPEVVI